MRQKRVADDDYSKFLDSFARMQSQYMDMWKTGDQKTEDSSVQNPWTPFLKNFWSSTSGPDASASSIFGGIAKQNKLMEQLTRCFEEIVNCSASITDHGSDEWHNAIIEALDELQTQLTASGVTPFTANPAMTKPWDELLTYWQDNMQVQKFDLPGFEGDFDPSLIPGLGPDREQYEKLKNLQSDIRSYQEAQTEYARSFSNFWPEVIEQLKSGIADTYDTDNEDQPSIATLFKLWTETAEQVYARTNQTDEYQKSYGALINASMALKKSIDNLQQDTLSELNIPTRNEIDTLSERLQRTRRENRQLRAELDELKAAFENSLRPSKADNRPAKKRKKAPAKKSSTAKASKKPRGK